MFCASRARYSGDPGAGSPGAAAAPPAPVTTTDSASANAAAARDGRMRTPEDDDRCPDPTTARRPGYPSVRGPPGPTAGPPGTMRDMAYRAADDRYDSMTYRRTGRSGLDLPAISLGLWHNFGDDVPFDRQRAILRRAFDLGVTHFDLANNYGPPYGTAETNFGRHLADDFAAVPRRARHLDQGRLRHVARPVRPGRRRPQVRAGQPRPVAAPDGPGLRRHLLLTTGPTRRRRSRRRWARCTPPSGRARRSTSASRPTRPQDTARAAAILADLGTPLLIHQPSYSMLNRWIETEGLLDTLEEVGAGCIAFSPLAQGMLTDKYLDGDPRGLAGQPGQVAVDRPAHRRGARRTSGR